MSRGSRFGYWNDTSNCRDTQTSWRAKEITTPVTTRSGLTTANPTPSSSENKAEPASPVKLESELPPEFEEKQPEVMAEIVDNDIEIGSLNAHLNGEPAQAIVVTPAQLAIEVKKNVLSVMPHYYGRPTECPYEFLHEFCKLCGIQKRPPRSIEEDYRLRALPFALRGETNAIKKEIQGARQDYDETLSQYWARFKGLLDSCPNNRMAEAEVYNIFYGGLTPECKDLVNTSSGGDFARRRVSEAKDVLESLIGAKKAYDSPRTILRRGSVDAVTVQTEDRMDARLDKLEKAIVSAIGKNNAPAPVEKDKQLPSPKEGCQNYGPQGEMECQAQVSAVGNWNQNNQNSNWHPWKIKDAPWRDNPCFRWADRNQNPPPEPQTTNPPEGQSNWPNKNQEGQNYQSNWSGRNQEGQNFQQNWSNRNQEGQNDWGNRNQGNQSNWVNRNQNQPSSNYVPPGHNEIEDTVQQKEDNEKGEAGTGDDPSFLSPRTEVENEEVRKETGEFSKGESNRAVKPFPYRREARKRKDDPVNFMEIFGKLEINL
ncbi:uncharacterized protein LOC121762364 [Salvia splendens]|uniref:uncharacterized protein LOC121762364 n=1 Tax=Salvia splendens TaxID=180675 RepID=UPI001C265509|nr:uncharacterized protein LOC121762364 [Salvia splendens]